MVEIATSVLNVEPEDSMQTFYNLEVAKTDYFHIDVMDGEFVEQNTKARMLEYTKQIKHISNLPLDVHLMVNDIRVNAEEYLCLEPNVITFHREAVKDIEEAKQIIQYIQENNCRVGISIKPDTKIKEIKELLPFVHLVLVMTVEPGKGGQALMPEMLKKIEQLKEYRKIQDLDFMIEADGGINLDTAEEVKRAGVDIMVVGTAIIHSNNFKDTIEKLRK